MGLIHLRISARTGMQNSRGKSANDKKKKKAKEKIRLIRIVTVDGGSHVWCSGDVMKAKSVAQCPVFTVPNRRRFRSCGQNEAWTTLTEAARTTASRKQSLYLNCST